MKQVQIIHNTTQERRGGFTLLEVMVSLALLGIALVVVLQLFSENIRSIGASEDYVAAVAKAEMLMRSVLDDDELGEKTVNGVTEDGYAYDVVITKSEDKKLEDLNRVLLDISLTLHWKKGSKEKSFALATMKTVPKKI